MKFLALALALTSAAADFSGIYVSYPIGADDPSRIVDRYEARQEGDTLTFWKSGAQVYGAWAIDGDAIRGLGALNAEITAEVVSKSASGQALKVTWSHGFESVLERTIDGRAPACGVESAANDIICSVGKPSPKANLGPHPEDKRVWGGCFIQARASLSAPPLFPLVANARARRGVGVPRAPLNVLPFVFAFLSFDRTSRAPTSSSTRRRARRATRTRTSARSSSAR